MYCCVFLKSGNADTAKKLLYKFAIGVAQATPGLDEVAVTTKGQYEECDVAVIYGSWKPRNQPWHNLKRDVVSKAKCFIVIETPLLGRGPVTEILKDKWYRIGINGLLADTADYNNNDPSKITAERWEKIQNELGVRLEPWKSNQKHGHFLLTLQLPEDASLRGANISKWAYEQAVKVRQISNKPIVLRTPQIKRDFDLDYINRTLEIKGVISQEGTKDNLKDTIDNSHRICTYSSGMGVEGVLAGIPTYAYDPASFVYGAMPKEPTVCNVDNDLMFRIDREALMRKLSYCQWSYDEVRMGLPWLHLRDRVIAHNA